MPEPGQAPNVVIHRSEFTTNADRIVRDHERDIAVVRARLV